MIRVTRTLTVLGLCASLALGAVTASATPARANNDDAVAIIGGLIALYAIGQAIQNSNGNVTASRNFNHRPHRPNRLVAPSRCFIQGRDQNGPYRGFLRNCTRNNVARPALLPNNCLRRVETQRGTRNIFRARCLARNGWTV